MANNPYRNHLPEHLLARAWRWESCRHSILRHWGMLELADEAALLAHCYAKQMEDHDCAEITLLPAHCND